MLSNFITVRNFFPWRRTIMYIDSRDYQGDNYIQNNNIPIRFKGDGVHPDKQFIFVVCSFNKKYIKQMVDCLMTLDKFMYIKYGNEYDNFKSWANKMFEGRLEL